jgi:hypothetical protein
LTKWLNIPEEWTRPPNLIYYVFIPFLGTFAIIWGILTATRARIFEKPKVNILLSFIFAIALFYSGILPSIVLYLFTFGGFFGVVAFFVLFFVLTSLFGTRKIGRSYKATQKVYEEAIKTEEKRVGKTKNLDFLERKLTEKQKELDKDTAIIRACNSLLNAINNQIHDTRAHLSSSPDHNKWLKVKDGVSHIAHKSPSTVGIARRDLAETARNKQRDVTILDRDILELRTRIDQLKLKI